MAKDNLNSGTGAGLTGLIGSTVFFILSAVLFITENYFGSLLFVSFALLFYVAGKEIQKIFLSAFTIFFSTRHLVSGATYIEETLQALTSSIKDLQNKPQTPGQKITLPHNPLVADLQKQLDDGKGFDSLEYTAHSYYTECHELYDFTSANLDFVAVSMPIFGLIATVLGLILMFDNLGGDISIDTLSPQLAMALKTTLYGALFSAVYKILGSRFERRIRTLDYDYETLCRGLQVLIENKVKIEMAK